MKVDGSKLQPVVIISHDEPVDSQYNICSVYSIIIIVIIGLELQYQ